MAPNKRTAGQNGKAAKKPKLDPITEKIEQVLDALRMQECEVPEPRTCLDSFLGAVPYALGHGAASNERHEYQTSVANMVGEILSATEVSWQQRVKQAKDNHEAAKNEEASQDAILEVVQSRFSGQRTKVEEVKNQVQADIKAETDAKKVLAQATWEVNNFDSMQSAKAAQRDEITEVLQNDFEKLKVAEYASSQDERVHLKKLMKILADLSPDKSLLSALPDALKKKPNDRGTFDNMVVSQAHDSLKAKLEVLEGELGKGEALKAEKQSEMQSAQAALAAAQETRAASEETLKEAEQKCSELEADENSMTESLKRLGTRIGRRTLPSLMIDR